MSLNMQEWRDETTEIVNELLADGSNPDADYDIEHHFACQDFDRLEKAAVDLFKAGFEVTDAEEMELDDGATIFCFDATIECKLNVEAIVADIAKMLPILENTGWITMVGAPTSRIDPASIVKQQGHLAVALLFLTISHAR